MRLIDADYVKDALSYIPWINTQATDDCIDKCPTVDAEPVRHGHWIFDEDEYFEFVRCSACGEEFTCWEADCAVTNYCPNCGAKMDGGEERCKLVLA